MTCRHLAPLLGFAALTACADSAARPVPMFLEPSADVRGSENVDVCHPAGQSAHIITVAMPALATHLAHGDYVAGLVVNPGSPLAGDGVHFTRMTDAVLAARSVRVARNERGAGACRITIDVTAGTLTGSFDAGVAPPLERFPLIIDVPDITLRGALQMQTDARGRATGNGRSAAEVTTLVPDRPIVFLPNTEAMIVVVAHPGGFAGDGTVIQGFDFQSGRSDTSSGGMGIIALRARNLTIQGNRFDHGLSSAGDLRSTSAHIDRNYGLRLGTNCSFCLAGPGSYEVSGNRLVDGGLGGIYVSAAVQDMPFSLGAAPVTTVEPDVLPAEAAVSAELINNDIHGHVRLPIGFAVRVLALGPGSSQVPQTTRVFMGNNDMTGNTFGLILDAGFPLANTRRRGDLNVTLAGNAIHANCQTNLLVAFTRHTGGLGITSNPWLVNSTFRVNLGLDLDWAKAWYADLSGQGNTLVVNGAMILPGTSTAYDPTRACPLGQ